MGWAERLNPNSDWSKRKAAEEAAENHIEVMEKKSRTITEWLYGRQPDGIA